MMDDKAWVEQTAERIKAKMQLIIDEMGNKVPYIAEGDKYDDRSDDICWWTNGFFGGILWQLYKATGIEKYKKSAVELEQKLDQSLMRASGLDHDNGFKWLPTAVANYRLQKNEDSRNRALLAADNMAGRFNVAGNFIRAWNDSGDGRVAGWAIIDCMMNLPLLYWAHEETNDPRYLHIATRHADTVMKYFVREDGSVKHIVEFDPTNGAYVQNYGGQGYSPESSWTRGQAWAIYGFTLSYIHTKEEKYLNCAKMVADYFIANMPENGLIPVDFQQPEEPAWEDSTAAAIASCGMIELSKNCVGIEKKIYNEAALKMLKALEKNRCDWTDQTEYIVEKGTEAYHSGKKEVPIIYGDYYFIEAIWKLTGDELFIW